MAHGPTGADATQRSTQRLGVARPAQSIANGLSAVNRIAEPQYTQCPSSIILHVDERRRQAIASGRCVRHLLRLLMWMAATIPALIGAGQPADADPGSEDAGGVSGPTVESIIRYPFRTLDDLAESYATSYTALRELKVKHRRVDPVLTQSDDLYEQFLEEVMSFTTASRTEGERVSVVDFGASRDAALLRLRQEVMLQAPPGGAVLRVYASKEAMPVPVRALFNDKVSGITRWCRFIAVDAHSRSQRELRDIISHELSHAFVCASLGLESRRLPRWFHEGLALYLSDAQDIYTSQTEYGGERIAYSTSQYNEYRLMFRYLGAILGRDGVIEFVRHAIVQRSAEDALRAVMGIRDGAALLLEAERWQRTRDIAGVALVLAPAALFLYLLHRRYRWRVTRYQEDVLDLTEQVNQHLRAARQEIPEPPPGGTITTAQTVGRHHVEEACFALIDMSRLLARKGSRDEAFEGVEKARRFAPWSDRVLRAAEDAEDEINGIVV